MIGILDQVCDLQKEKKYQFIFENGNVLVIQQNAVYYHVILHYENDCIFLEWSNNAVFSGIVAYSLYETYGLPLEDTVDEVGHLKTEMHLKQETSKMRAYIHAFHGRPWNTECRAAYEGFQKLGIETVLFSTNEEFDTRHPEDVVVGGTVIIWHALNQRGIIPEHYDYPQELTEFCGRKIKQMKLKNVRDEKLPVFIKSVEDKAAPGIVINSWTDLEEYKWLDPEFDIYCSECVHFVSEWRCFMIYGQLADIRFYYGDESVKCDQSIIYAAIRAYPKMPAGCALDFGVTDDGRTLLIEMNDGYSLGIYGLDPTLYARLLTARWAELNGTIDSLTPDHGA